MRKWLVFPIMIAAFLPEEGCALPQIQQIVAGSVDAAHPSPDTLQLTVSDRAIINYDSFSVAGHERVEFIQPSKSASVLNRVVGVNPSKIFGEVVSNGRLFLVNENGIYFGPRATVSVGSLIASTFNIQDDDFLNGRFKFSGKKTGSLTNEGKISGEESIVLLSSHIENCGTLLASKVAFLAGSSIVLDFTGDGLLNFAVEGPLEEALIAHLGKIEAPQGAVFLRMNVADKVIQQVLNTDGFEEGARIIKENGMIYLASGSQILASEIVIEGAGVQVEGALTACEGVVHLLGDSVALRGATIDCSGQQGGGTVLVGGDYQGEGDVRTSVHVLMDDASVIRADALSYGDGGKVVLWADERLLFGGTISARGGAEGGNGGFVETSSKGGGIILPIVPPDTAAPFGRFGKWLIDPVAVVVATGGGSSLAQVANCGVGATLTIDPITINPATSEVVLCGTTSVTVDNAIAMTVSGVPITLKGSPTTAITLNAGISTTSGVITFTGNTTIATGAIALSTTGGGTGADVILAGTIDGGQNLTVTAGIGNINVAGSIGSTTPVAALSLAGSSIVLGGSTYTSTAAQTLNGNITLGANATFTSGLNTNITVVGTINGDGILTRNLTMTTGAVGSTGNISISSQVGGVHPLGSIALNSRAGTLSLGDIGMASAAGATSGMTLTSANVGVGAITLNGDSYNVSGASQTYAGNVQLTAPSTNFISNNQAINFSQTLNGTSVGLEGVIISAGTGAVTWTGNVGSTTRLDGIYIRSANGVTALGSLFTTNLYELVSTGANSFAALDISGAPGIVLNGSTMTFNGTINTTGNGPLFITNSGVMTLPSGSNATLTGGMMQTGAGSVSLGGNITVSTTADVIFSSPVTLTGPGPITITTGLGDSQGEIAFLSTVDGAFALNLTGGASGSVDLGTVGGITPLSSLTVTAGTVTQNTSAKTTGAITYNGPNRINLGGDMTTSGAVITLTGQTNIHASTTIDTTNGGSSSGANITTATFNGAFPLTLKAGAGAISFGNLGGATPPTSITIEGVTIAQTGTARSTGVISYTGINSLGGNMTTSGSTITLTGATTLTANVVIDTTNNGSAPAGANVIFTTTLDGAESLTLDAGTGGGITFTGAVGNLSRLGGVIILEANSVTALSSFKAGSLNENNLTGANSFGAIDTNEDAGILLNGTTVSCNGAINTTGGGSLTIFHSGLLTLPVSAPVTLTGSFTENGGAVSLGANVTVSTNNAITFSDPISLTASVALTTGGGVGGDIILGSTVNGAFGLTLNGGAQGNISFGAIGGTTPLSFLSATGGIISQASTVHTTGAISYTATNRLNLAGNATTNGSSFTVSGQTITSTPVTIDTTNSGGFPGAPISFLSINGAFPLALTAGTATVSYGPIGATFPPTSFTVIGSTINQNSSVKIVGAVSYTGAVNVGGNIITNGGPITLTGPAMLNAPSLIDATNNSLSPAGASILFSSTLDGTQTLTLASGTTGSITFAGTVGSLPLGIVTITNANGVTASSSFSAFALSESFATGVNNFGNLTTTGVGIILKGSTINLNGSVTTLGGGGLSITNTGPLTLGGTLSLNGPFTQLGGGAISLGANITTTGNSPISFVDAVTLTGAGPITLTTVDRKISFLDTLDGAQACVINVGKGVALFNQPVGSITPLSSLTVTAESVFQNSSVQTTGTLNYIADASIGGNITTNLNPISIIGNVTQINTSPVILSTGGGAGTITVGGSIDADLAGRTLVLNSSDATTTLEGVIGGNVPFTNLTVSGNQITVAGIGNALPGVSGSTVLTATGGAIHFSGGFYSANNVIYTSPTAFNLTHPGDTSFQARAGDIQFATGTITLSNGTNFVVSTNNGNLSFPSLRGTTSHNVQFSLGSGIANLGTIGIAADIHSVVGSAGTIFLGGPITTATLNLQGGSSILNAAAPVKLTAIGFIQLNSLTGTLGTVASPLDVDPPLVIAGSSGATYLTGSTGDNTIHCYPGNSPSLIIFNGSVIPCGVSPPGPTPSPSPISPTATTLARQRIGVFYVPGVYSPDYNLSSDFYYLEDFTTSSDIQSLFIPLYGIKDKKQEPIQVMPQPKKRKQFWFRGFLTNKVLSISGFF